MDVDSLNAGYASTILEQYLESPDSVPPEWRALFEAGASDVLAALPGLSRLLERVRAGDGNGGGGGAGGARCAPPFRVCPGSWSACRRETGTGLVRPRGHTSRKRPAASPKRPLPRLRPTSYSSGESPARV